MQNFRRLRVWRHSQALAVESRKATRSFPRAGYSSLRDQIIRAAESIPANIAEGCGASTQKEFARFLDISIKSTSELESELDLAREYGILRDKTWAGLNEKVTDSRRMLCGLRAKVNASPGA